MHAGSVTAVACSNVAAAKTPSTVDVGKREGAGAADAAGVLPFTGASATCAAVRKSAGQQRKGPGTSALARPRKAASAAGRQQDKGAPQQLSAAGHELLDSFKPRLSLLRYGCEHCELLHVVVFLPGMVDSCCPFHM